MNRIELYQDYELAKIALSDGFVKEAQIMDYITKMVGSHIDKDNITRTLVDFLAPSAIGMIAGALGMPLLGTLIPIASEMLHFSVYDTISELASFFGKKIQSGEKLSEQDIKSQVEKTVDEKSKSVEKAASTDYRMQVRASRLLNQQLKNKTALSIASAPKVKSILVQALILLFTLVLKSFTSLVVGEVANTAVGRPSGLSGTFQKGKDEGGGSSKPQAVSLPLNEHYSDSQEASPWIVKIKNDSQSIEQMLIQFTNEVYKNLSSKMNVIKSVPAFQATVKAIYSANSTMPDANFVIIPSDIIKAYSKKQLVDIFLLQAQDLIK
jgi:hypothetical protein